MSQLADENRLSPPTFMFPAAEERASIQCSASDEFQAWLSQAGGSIAVTTYQAGMVALIGWDGRQVTMVMRRFQKPMGLAVHGDKIALATQHEVLLFADAALLAHDYLPEQPGKYDSLFLPRAAFYTGDINTHDLAFGDDQLWLVNTRFGCLAHLSTDFSFVPAWVPPFVSDIAPEDRCHLNGLAMVEDRPRYVTAFAATDTPGGWRLTKDTSGLILDVDSGQIVLSGLSMPHSPRWHDGQLWVLNSGRGELCRVDQARGQYDVVARLPGYLRGLCFTGTFALVGMSQARERSVFGEPGFDTVHNRMICGIAIVDLRTGLQMGVLEFTSGCQELYDVQFLPGRLRPTILNLQKEAVHEAITAPDFAYWLRPSSEMAETSTADASERERNRPNEH